MNRLKSGRILLFLFLASVFLLNIFRIKDTDAWMHLSLGRLIWELKGLPAKEPLVYTTPDSPFIYSSWLFSVVYYLLFKAFNAPGIVLFKAATVTFAFYVLLRDSLRKYLDYVVSIIVLTGIVYISKYRFVERPDTFFMVFLACNIFFINLYISDNRKYIYALPFINMVWANCHSSVNLIFAIFPAFICGGLIQYRFDKKGGRFADTPSLQQVKTLCLIFAASFAATLVNPYFIKQYFYGANVLSSAWAKQNVLELQSPIWPFNKSPYILTSVIFFSFILNRRRFSVMHFLLVLPFIFLSFTARRFMFLAGIAAGPIIAQNISSYIEMKPWKGIVQRVPAVALFAVALVGFTWFAVFKDDPHDYEKRAPGLGANYNVVPEDALRYMDQRGITGRIFNVMSLGGYINWRDFPKRSVFIDPRFHLPDELLLKMQLAGQRPEVLDELEKAYGFESILLTHPIMLRGPHRADMYQDKDLYLTHPGWALVYWDDFSLVYLKKGGKYDSVIGQDAYRFVKPANFSPINRAKLHEPDYRSSVLAELERNVRLTGSSRVYALLGQVYNDTGQYREAAAAFLNGLKKPIGNSAKLYDGLADAESKLGAYDYAVAHYKKSQELSGDASKTYKAGLCLLAKGEREKAAGYLQQTTEENPAITSAFRKLNDLYVALGRKDEAAKVLSGMEAVKAGLPGRDYFSNGLAAYAGGRSDIALTAFEQAVGADPNNPDYYSAMGQVFFDLGQTEAAYEYQTAAKDIDPEHPAAAYRLALIYKKWGDQKAELKNLEDYLRLDPSGPYAAVAGEELKAAGAR